MTRTQLVEQIFEKKSFLCIGLDAEIERLPEGLKRDPDGLLDFNRRIIDATRDLCVAYKPNLAFYEKYGARGWAVFEKTIAHIGPEHLRIADAKRGDIGNTGRAYAEAFFGAAQCDAVTAAPYMGEDSVRPFLEYPDKWTVLLALTSNPGSADFQMAQQDGGDLRLFEKVLRKAADWGDPERLMFVVGATHPSAFEAVRRHAPEYFLLVPGIGAQGGDLEGVCRAGMLRDCGLLVNASRSVIYAGSGADFAEKARAAAADLQRQMAQMLERYAL